MTSLLYRCASAHGSRDADHCLCCFILCYMGGLDDTSVVKMVYIVYVDGELLGTMSSMSMYD